MQLRSQSGNMTFPPKVPKKKSEKTISRSLIKDKYKLILDLSYLGLFLAPPLCYHTPQSNRPRNEIFRNIYSLSSHKIWLV